MCVLVVGIIALLFAPVFADPFTIIMLVRFMYFGLMTISFAFLASQLGLISLMVPSFYAIVAYFIAISHTRELMAMELAIPMAFLVSMSFAAVSGIMVNRTKAITFLLLTLVLSQLVHSLALSWISLTNGVDGLVGISFPEWLNIFSDRPDINEFYWAVIAFSITAGLVWLLTKSQYGLKLRGIRESESRMKALGYNTAMLKWSAFMIAAFVSSVGGLLYIYFMRMVTPEIVTLGASNQSLISSILGGINSVFAGPIIGTVIYLTLNLTLSGFISRYLILIGLLFLLVILFLPNGLISVLESNRIGRVINRMFIFRKKAGGDDDGKPSGSGS